jgi:ribonuclease BN (tRNA processing enzyme)
MTLVSSLLSVSLFVSCADPPAQTATPPEPAPRASRTQLVLLGTGTPVPDPDRSGPALAVVVDDVPYLVDCGPGVVRRASAAWRGGVPGLEMRNLERVFITHLHSDHTVGLPDLIFTPWVLGRRRPLQVFGPKGVEAMVEHVLAAYAEDVRVRTTGFEKIDPAGGRAVARTIEPGLCYEDERVRVRAFRVPHGQWEDAFGFRFETPDRTIVVSGDTGPSDALVEAARGADILVHEVYSAEIAALFPEDLRRYHGSFHTSTLELAAIAERARPGLLVLTHQLFAGAAEEDLVREIRKVYGGKVVSGKDLDVY